MEMNLITDVERLHELRKYVISGFSDTIRKEAWEELFTLAEKGLVGHRRMRTETLLSLLRDADQYMSGHTALCPHVSELPCTCGYEKWERKRRKVLR